MSTKPILAQTSREAKGYNMNSFETALDLFVKHVQSIVNENSYFNTKIIAKAGSKNVKIIKQETNGPSVSVYCFVRKADGAVLKAAGWNAPAKHARGTIYTDDPTRYGVSSYGAHYIK